MKILFVIMIIVFVFLGLLAVWGATLPTAESLSRTIQIDAPVEKVWGTMSDWEEQVAWRNDVKSVEIIDGKKFKEFPTNGPAVEFEIVRLEANKIIELKMSGVLEGNYLAEFSENNGITTIQVSETMIQESVIGRIFSKLFFDLDEFVTLYFEQLKAQVEK